MIRRTVRIFTTQFYPEATPEQARSFTELQRVSASAQNAGAILACTDQVDVRELAPQLRVQTLVLHCQQELRVPFEQGRLLASLIPGARLVPLQSRNHIPLAIGKSTRLNGIKIESFAQTWVFRGSCL